MYYSLKKIWENEENRTLIKDVLLLGVATVVFHFLYWSNGMNNYIFGPWTDDVYGFFTHLVYKCANFLLGISPIPPYDAFDTSIVFWRLNNFGEKIYYSAMMVVADCSGVKQMLQFGLIMILCRGKWWKKIAYFLCGCVVIQIANILRVYLLTILIGYHPEYFSWIHDWVARPTMYVIIFAMWYVWIKFFVKKRVSTESQDVTSLK